MAGLEDGIVFQASDGFTVSDGLWSTGPTGDIRLLAEVSIHAGDEYPGSSAMASTGSRILFSGAGFADLPFLGRELWTSDGTAEGTRPAVDLRPGREGSSPHDLAAFRGEVAFIASPAGIAAGESLWISDGTAPGTRKISDLAPAGGPSWAGHLTVLGERLVFVATDQRTGPELWTSDGTAAGTELVADLRPGPRGSYPQSLAAIGDLLVFAADDGESGLEAWVSDGTAAGTRRLADVAPGRDASSPSDFTLAGELLYFWADDAIHGRELWALRVAALEEPGPEDGTEPPPPPPPGEWLASPELPGFRAKARITPPGLPPAAGRRVADCIVETLCIEGLLAARPEAFLKVIGPRPNGFLWVQISRFTPSEIELWVEQTATGELRYYRLGAVGPGDPDVSGLQDRGAFRP
jgi:ELWxxDGT repeat protein